MKIISANTLICFIIIFLHSTVTSALMEGLSIKNLVKESDVIIQGVVENVDAMWSYDNKNIYTSATIHVEQVIRGTRLRKKITVEYLGGEIGDIGMGISDSPQLFEGEEVILFLKPEWSHNSRKHGVVYNIFGAAQGKYSISELGIAHKEGFSIMSSDKKNIDNEINIDAFDLIEKIKGIN